VLPASADGGLRFFSRAAGAALLKNSRKTERGAKEFLIRMAVRAVPFAVIAGLPPAIYRRPPQRRH
jgi:hypothetical protein